MIATSLITLLVLMALAGYDPHEAIGVWERMRVANTGRRQAEPRLDHVAGHRLADPHTVGRDDPARRQAEYLEQQFTARYLRLLISSSLRGGTTKQSL